MAHPYKSLSENGTLSRKASLPMDDARMHTRELDVEPTKARPHRRQDGQVPYPVRFDSNVREFEVWDHGFLMKCLNGKSLAHITTSPTRVLDIGCGVGNWVMDAAGAWTDATFVGFDVNDIQPNLDTLIDVIGEDVRRRIRWVHGNFLERLPFDDEEFDFVRMARIGPGVPEDEWQDVIEEVHRVLKPGCLLEVIEEDIIFPCPRPPKSVFENDDRMATPTPFSNSYRDPTVSYTNREDNNGKNHSPYSDREFNLAHEASSSKASSYEPTNRQSVDLQASLKRDHSILKDAYEAVFQKCFINPQVLTILPFYLQTTFPNMMLAYPVVNIYVPSPSMPDRQIRDAYAIFRQSSDSVTLVENPSTVFTTVRNTPIQDIWPTTSPNREELIDIASYHMHMHLGRAVALVTACKEALWEQYERLHRHKRAQPNPSLDREDFEMYFRNWECDMLDRIGMRYTLQQRMGMKEPIDHEQPDWKIWRDKQAEVEGFNISSVASRGEPSDICRTMRAFVCRKSGGEDYASDSTGSASL